MRTPRFPRWVLTRARFLAGTAGALLLGARRRDAGWHHVHGANGLTLPTDLPLELTFVTVDGAPYRLADHRAQVVVVNLFATWCGPCNAEMPALRAFAAAHAADTAVIGVDVGEPPQTARAFAARTEVDYPMAVDESSALSKTIGMSAYPTTLFIRVGGTLACAFVGELSRDDLESEWRYAQLPTPLEKPRTGA